MRDALSIDEKAALAPISSQKIDTCNLGPMITKVIQFSYLFILVKIMNVRFPNQQCTVHSWVTLKASKSPCSSQVHSASLEQSLIGDSHMETLQLRF
jgi:hypothetical protein